MSLQTPLVSHNTMASNNRYTDGSEAPDYRSFSPHTRNESSVANLSHGVPQGPKWQDSAFLVLFFVALAGFVAISAVYCPAYVASLDLTSLDTTSSSLLWVGTMQIAVACLLCVGSLTFMISCASSLISGCLFANVIFSLASSAAAFVNGWFGAGFLWLLLSALSLCYAYAVQDRIPFATSILRTSIHAVKANLGLLIIALGGLFLAVGWTVWWSLAFLSISFSDTSDDGDNPDVNGAGMNGGGVFLMLFMFYWMHQIISNVSHVTVSGTVGTWWFNPAEAASCCSEAVSGSLRRSLSYSLGSIALGSLLVALIQTIRAFVQQLRQQSDDSILVCIADCILGCIEGIARYFNKWAFVYVGLYGYSYMEAGKNVVDLFADRGWSAIINDNLISMVFSFLAVSIGALVGAAGIVAAAAIPKIANEEGALYVVFFFGLLIGITCSSIMFSVIQSAVDTAVVCFAEAPLVFQTNHPVLYDEMSIAWLAIYPWMWNPNEMRATAVGGGKQQEQPAQFTNV
jgi:hypothetical protein